MDANEDLKAEFAEFDRDRDGKIDWSEFRRLLTRLGLRRTDAVMQEVFRSVDENRDGYISYAEFKRWWQAEAG